ncbi:MAG: Acylphosphatase [Elusimicrobia bacterium]|nr:Acylphosphatase [Elusimicrobiota bacterium]
MATNKSTKHLLIKGEVQGVGYRMSMYYAAKRLGVAGWVRNRRDGTVEAMVQGETEAVESFIAWAHKGPDLARVDEVSVTEGAGEYSEFTVRNSI